MGKEYLALLHKTSSCGHDIVSKSNYCALTLIIVFQQNILEKRAQQSKLLVTLTHAAQSDGGTCQ